MMAPKAKALSQPSGPNTKKQKASATRPRTVALNGSGPSSSTPARSRKLDPLTAFSLPPSTPPLTTSSSSSSNSIPSLKGKGKAKAPAKPVPAKKAASDDSLWVDRYEPASEAELAVHVKKVENVRQWLREAFEGGPSGTLKKYRRILTLTGPAGTGKTSTLRVLAREMGLEMLEWKSSFSESTSASSDQYQLFDDNPHLSPSSNEGLFTRFEAFLTRSSTCNTLFSSTASSKASGSQQSSQRKFILLEDLPNILHQKTQERFHEALSSFVNTQPSEPPVPLVIIISDAGLRGEDRDARMAEGRATRDKNQIIDVRTVIPKDLLSSVYVTEISFNPIAPTLLRKALQAMLTKHFSQNTNGSGLTPSKEVLEAIVESSNGDIRSAIMALQFACIVEMPSRKKKTQATRMVMEAVTRREQTLAMFHMLGKVLYNKRKGDPPSASATAKDLQKERELDSLLKDPNILPSHLRHHERRASRVDVDMLYSDSPIDSSLFSLYIHQNYTQFCDNVDHCLDVSDWLSWVDSSGGEAWYQANPHQFHLLALGTLHSLPSPVQRRSQKYYKPEFFSCLQKEKQGLEGVRRTKDWLVESIMSTDDSGWRAGGWSQTDIILELGAVLKAYETLGAPPSVQKPPTMHKMFSKMDFTRGEAIGRLQQLDEHDIPESSQGLAEDGELWESKLTRKLDADQNAGGWLESDDIQDFD